MCRHIIPKNSICAAGEVSRTSGLIQHTMDLLPTDLSLLRTLTEQQDDNNLDAIRLTSPI